jgi:intracellular multiplication protein IcmL
MSDAAYTKGPPEIDAELRIAYSERRSLRMSIMVLMALLAILVLTLYVLVRANLAIFPRHEVVYTTNAAAVCDFTPVAERGQVSGALVENFAAGIARELHLLDYVNYRSTLARVMDRTFTPAARADTTRAMLESGLLRTVTRNGFVVKALPDDRPAILREGVETRLNGGLPEPTYTWVVQVPVMLAYAHRGDDNAPTYRPERRHVYMTIIRTEPTAANPLGLLVSRLISLQPTEEFDLLTMIESEMAAAD